MLPTSIAYVAWVLGRDPTRRVIVCSYSGDFAAELHRQFLMVATSQWDATLFPDVRWAKETGFEFVTTRGGGRYETSIGGTLTGRGADLIIVDDPLNANDVHSEPARKRVVDWFAGSVVSRLNEKETGAIVAVMQRLHEDDLPVTFCVKAVGSFGPAGDRRRSTLGAAECSFADRPTSFIPSAKAERPWTPSRRRSEASCSPPNINSNLCLSRAI